MKYDTHTKGPKKKHPVPTHDTTAASKHDKTTHNMTGHQTT